MFGRFRVGQWNKGKGLGYLIGVGDAYSRGPNMRYQGHKGKGKELWCLIGVGDAYSCGPIWDAMGNWGMMYSIGRGCNGISYAFLQCGTIGDPPYLGDVCRKWGSMAGFHQLSWVKLGRVPEIMYNGGRESWPVLVWSKQETNGQKIPVIGSKVKVSIIPHAAAIQCWCSSPVESSLVVWSTIGGRAYGLVT